MRQRIEFLKTDSYKTGINEIKGLREAMLEIMKPVQAAIKDKIYWSEVNLEEAEYKSRDGFLAHSHNCGGIQITEVIPKCEEYDFGFLEFGECDECGDAEQYPKGDHRCGYEGVECAAEAESHLDACLRIWFKFEGYDQKTGELNFYLVLHGGNGDAPYFRPQYSTNIFEASFSCKSVEGLKRAAAKHFRALLKVLE